jgi:hypothetical protein
MELTEMQQAHNMTAVFPYNLQTFLFLIGIVKTVVILLRLCTPEVLTE